MNEQDWATFKNAVRDALKQGQKGEYDWRYVTWVREPDEEWLPQEQQVALVTQVCLEEAEQLGGRIEIVITVRSLDDITTCLRAAPPTDHSTTESIVSKPFLHKATVDEIRELVMQAVYRNIRGDTRWSYYRFVWDAQAPNPPPNKMQQISATARHMARGLDYKLKIKLEQTDGEGVFRVGLRVNESRAWALGDTVKEMRQAITRGAKRCLIHRNLLGLTSLNILSRWVEVWEKQEREKLG